MEAMTGDVDQDWRVDVLALALCRVPVCAARWLNACRNPGAGFWVPTIARSGRIADRIRTVELVVMLVCLSTGSAITSRVRIRILIRHRNIVWLDLVGLAYAAWLRSIHY